MQRKRVLATGRYPEVQLAELACASPIFCERERGTLIYPANPTSTTWR